MKVANLILTGVVILLFISCQGQSNEIRTNINRIVEKLSKEKEVHFGYPVGIGGKPETNKYYRLYLKLSRKAKNSELIALTNNNSEIIVVYAFKILHERQYDKLKNVFEAHRNDTTYFWTAGGCTGFMERVNQFMLRELNPFIKGVRKYFTEEEYSKYCEEFKKEDHLFICNSDAGL
jgi:hypothetical protein